MSFGLWDRLKAWVQGGLGLRPTDAEAEKHVEAKNPDWSSFQANMDRSSFRQALKRDPRADDTLKQFVDVQDRIKTHKGHEVLAPSRSGKGDYRIQYHSDIGRFTCTCPDFTYRKFKDAKGECDHIKAEKTKGHLDRIKTSALQSSASASIQEALSKCAAPAMDLRLLKGPMQTIPTEDAKIVAAGKLRSRQSIGRVGGTMTNRAMRAPGRDIAEKIQ